MARRMEMVESQVRDELDALKGDIDSLRGDIKSLLRSVRSDGRNRARNAMDTLRLQARQRLEQIRGRLDEARDYGRQAVGKVQSRVEQRPMVSVLAALGVGMLLGRLAIRR